MRRNCGRVRPRPPRRPTWRKPRREKSLAKGLPGQECFMTSQWLRFCLTSLIKSVQKNEICREKRLFRGTAEKGSLFIKLSRGLHFLITRSQKDEPAMNEK